MLTNAKQPCIRPAVYHSLMLHLGTTEQLVTMLFPDGITFQAFYVHTISGEQVRDVTINLQQGTTLHFAASKFPGWYYILQYSPSRSRYGCSCFNGKQGNRCPHMHIVEQQAQAVAHA